MATEHNIVWRKGMSFVVKNVNGYVYHTIKGNYFYTYDIHLVGQCARMSGPFDLPGADEAMAAVMMDAMK